jgi:hypothetical protein
MQAAWQSSDSLLRKQGLSHLLQHAAGKPRLRLLRAAIKLRLLKIRKIARSLAQVLAVQAYGHVQLLFACVTNYFPPRAVKCIFYNRSTYFW